MHLLTTLIADTTTTVAKSSSKSSSSSVFLLFILLIFGGLYMLVIRPRQQKMRQQQTAARQLEIGDQVITAGGIHGRLVAVDDEVAEVEVAPGIVLTLLRRAVNARPGVATVEPEPVDDQWEVPGRSSDSSEHESSSSDGGSSASHPDSLGDPDDGPMGPGPHK